MIHARLRRGQLCLIGSRSRGMQLHFAACALRIHHRSHHLCPGAVVQCPIYHLCHFARSLHVHMILSQIRVSGGIVHDPLPQLHIIIPAGKVRRPFSRDITVPCGRPAKPVLPYRQDRRVLLHRFDHRIGRRLRRSGDITVQDRPPLREQIVGQLISPAHRQRELPILQIAVTA